MRTELSEWDVIHRNTFTSGSQTTSNQFSCLFFNDTDATILEPDVSEKWLVQVGQGQCFFGNQSEVSLLKGHSPTAYLSLS